MVESQAGHMERVGAIPPSVPARRRRLLSPYDYTIEGVRLGNLTGRDLKTLVERLHQKKDGAAFAKQLVAENHL